jgi:fructokinase
VKRDVALVKERSGDSGSRKSGSARIGIDWGGTKIEVLAMDEDGCELHRKRIPTPRHDYEGSICAATALVLSIEQKIGETCPVGVGIPGMIDPATGLVRNANSTWLNGKPLQSDLEIALRRRVRCVNDANCLALSEAIDGAGFGKQVVFAAILGTGCGAGLAIGGRVHSGINGLAGEWGHNPLPWPRPDEYPGEPCYCGQRGCIEGWLSGPALEEDHRRRTGDSLSGEQIVDLCSKGDSSAEATLVRYEDRLARSLAHVVNLLDPDVIVLGGGLSKVSRLYRTLPSRISSYVFGKIATTPILPARHGDSSGVRGAARLWALSLNEGK